MIHPHLARQLKKLGLADLPPSQDSWHQLLEAVSRTYSSNDEDRARLERSLDVSSQQMIEVNTRLHAEKSELNRRKQEMADFFEYAPIGICRLLPDGTILEANRAELAIFGRTHDEYLGRRYAGFFEQPEKIDQAIASILAGNTVDNLEVWARAARGERRCLHLNACGHVVEGVLVDIRCFTRDVTVVRLAEQAEIDRVERANQAKNEFLSRMSHELRTPMNSILGFAQLMEMHELPEELADYVHRILAGGRHLLKLIDEVLNISRIEAGTMSLSLEPVELHKAVAEAIKLISPIAKDHGIRIQRVAHSAMDLTVMADCHRLNQILINLLSNAVKYNRPNGEITCEIDMTAASWGRISVTDTGQGISKDAASRLFVPFERLGAEQTSIEGTGLGLALSRKLAEAMRGKLYLDQYHAGPGCRFVLDLPIVASEQLLAPPESATVVLPVVPNAAPKTILLIEDNNHNIKLIERIIDAYTSARLLVAVQGRVGISFVKAHRPDLILLDMHLPDMTGDQVAQELRKDPELSRIPIVAITADATQTTSKKFTQVGVVAQLTKPIDVKMFLELVTRILTGEASEAA